MPKGPAQQYASDYTDRIVKHHYKGIPLPIGPVIALFRPVLQSYLEIAFNAGVNHAAGRFMEDSASGEPFQASKIAVFDRQVLATLPRFDLNPHDGEAGMEPAANGDFVKFGDVLSLGIDGDAIRNAPGMVVSRLMTTEEAQKLGASLEIDWSKQPERMARKEAQEQTIRQQERERLSALMDQVAREAIASVNETAATSQDHTLIVFGDGQWITLKDERLDHWKTPVSRLEIKHYDTAEELADALRASVSA